MPQRKSFIILDIDGVLLEAHGYRMACIDTINDFLRQMGQPFLQIDRTITDAFEASGIACEWDMVPLALASFVNWYMELTDAEPEAKNYYPDCDKTVIRDNAAFNDMLMKKIAYFSSLIDPAETAINGIYNALLKSDGKGLEKLWKTPFRSHFFVDTLNSRKSPSFAQLMNRLLGSDEFTGFYGFDAPISVESYLETKDRILISEQYRKKLQNTAGENIYPAVMTYRPSGFPAGVGNIGRNNDVNTPEGECALRLLEWDHGRVPMIGAGSLCYIEEKYDLRREYYVKPHPLHAL